MLKQLLQKALKEDYAKYPNLPIYLEFSAGCDSTALFLSMIELKEYPFACITYYYQQKRIYLNKVNSICKLYNVPLKIITLTKEQILANMRELKDDGYKGRVLLDCLSGHLPITKILNNSLVVNGSYADVLYGSYFFQFKPTMTNQEFNDQRLKLLYKHDQDGVYSLTKLLKNNNNYLSTPFSNKVIVDYFLTKDFQSCGGTRKTLFDKEFFEELKRIPYKIRRQAQQIESGIRDLRKSL